MQIFKTDLFIINKNNGNNPNAHQILNKQNTVCPYNGTLFSHYKEMR